MQLELFSFPAAQRFTLNGRTHLRTVPAAYRPLVKELRSALHAADRSKKKTDARKARAAEIVSTLNELTADFPPYVWTMLDESAFAYLDLIDHPQPWAAAMDWKLIFRYLCALILIDQELLPAARGHLPTSADALVRFNGLVTAMLKPTG